MKYDVSNMKHCCKESIKSTRDPENVAAKSGCGEIRLKYCSLRARLRLIKKPLETDNHYSIYLVRDYYASTC